MTTKQLLLILFVILYISCVFVGRTFIVWRNTKKFPITYGKTDSAHDFLGRMFKILIILSIASPIIYVTSGEFYQYLLPLKIFEINTLEILGLVLAYISMIWTIIAQTQMGTSWRIGIDENNKTELVQKGLFKISRHPIYLGVMTTSFSLFLVLPNVFNLIVFLMTFLTIMVQARLEEEHMAKIYSEEYLSYSKNTPRWFSLKLFYEY